MELITITDKELFKYCQQIGAKARKWKNEFVALLPEVYRRRLYRKRGFCSIYEFAAKLGGVSNSVVDEVIRVDEKLEAMPKLKKLMSKVGVSKLRSVVCIAKKETDQFWADKVENMTRKALETYIKDTKFPGELIDENANLSLFKKQNSVSETENLKAQIQDKSTFSMQLSDESILNLRLIKQKFEKESKEALCWDEIVEKVTKEILAEKSVRKYKTKPSKSRNLPAQKKRNLSKKCEAPNCNKPVEVIHHPDRYSITKSHDNLKPLCKAHHELAHRGYIDEKNDFRTLIKPIIDPIKAAIDQRMLKFLHGT